MEKKIPSQFRYAFLCCILGGYAFHLYAFTNLIPNSDGLSRVYDLQEMTISGRWFLHYATMFNGFMQMPSFIALITLLFLSLTVVLIVDLLEIKNSYFAGLLGLSFVAFPSLAFTFLYLFTASAYSFAIFLAVFSVWCSQKEGYFWILAILSLTLSMGIYQAYAPFAIGLSVILVIKKVLDSTVRMKEVVVFGVKLLGYLSVSALLYYVVLQIALQVTGQELLSYQGMGEESYPFSALPSLIISCYKQVLFLFLYWKLQMGTNSLPLVFCHIILIALGLYAIFLILKPYWKKEVWRIIFMLLLCAICPLAFGFVQIISPWIAPTPLMQYSYVVVYVLLLFFFDRSLIYCKSRKQFVMGTALLFCMICFCSGWLCNLLYTASAQAHRATESYVTRLLSRVESTEGYRWNMPILVIGAFPQDKFYADIPAYAMIDHYSAATDSVLPLNKHIYYYFNDWLNVPVEEPSEAVMIAMSERSEFLEMPCYPDDGSVKIVDGQVVVKVGETYFPKSDYELVYENRK